MGFLGIKYPDIFIPEIGMSRIYDSLLTYNGKKNRRKYPFSFEEITQSFKSHHSKLLSLT